LRGGVTGTVGSPCVTVGGSTGVVVVSGGAACVVVVGAGAAWVAVVRGGAGASVVVDTRGAVEVVVKVVCVVAGPPPGGLTVRVVTETVSPGAGCIVRVVTSWTVVVGGVDVTGDPVDDGGATGVEGGGVEEVEVALVVIVDDGGAGVVRACDPEPAWWRVVWCVLACLARCARLEFLDRLELLERWWPCAAPAAKCGVRVSLGPLSAAAMSIVRVGVVTAATVPPPVVCVPVVDPSGEADPQPVTASAAPIPAASASTPASAWFRRIRPLVGTCSPSRHPPS
jgi:hypothetical protein